MLLLSSDFFKITLLGNFSCFCCHLIFFQNQFLLGKFIMLLMSSGFFKINFYWVFSFCFLLSSDFFQNHFYWVIFHAFVVVRFFSKSLITGFFLCFFVVCWSFFKINIFEKFFQEHHQCPTIWIQIVTEEMLVLIWIQTVKGYQQ